MTLGAAAMRGVAASSVIALYLAMCGTIFYAQWRRRRRAASEAAALMPSAGGESPWLVAFASQTGSSEELAWQTARALHTAGVPARVAALSEVGPDALRQAERVLFITSTYGEGDPPDNAAHFARDVMGVAAALPNLRFGLLALGDRQYANFCGFGRQLDAWLRAHGAQPLFERIEVDNNSETALQQWLHQLGRVAGISDLPEWQAPSYGSWRLAARRRLNPGSAGGPTFHLELEPADAAIDAQWQAGDLVQVLAPADPQRPREYSIASLPSDGRLHLLVRQERHGDGQPGVASGWLTEQAALGASIDLRLRPHRNFRIGDNAERPLILIGNGTGLAGLRSHLKARAAAGRQRNWLVFGERNEATDFYYREEIEAWQAQGILARADIVFSRDQPTRVYVQHRLREAADTVRAWLADGAAIYVCGSLEGMAGAVEAALQDIAGVDGVEQLIRDGRYRRDVY